MFGSPACGQSKERKNEVMILQILLSASLSGLKELQRKGRGIQG